LSAARLVESGKEDTITAVVEKFRGFEPTLNPEGKPSA
jgi:hypothetical protein